MGKIQSLFDENFFFKNNEAVVSEIETFEILYYPVKQCQVIQFHQ